MKITILTLFKEQFSGFTNTSIIKRAIDKKIVDIEVINYRDYSNDKLKRVDQPPYGGGAGRRRERQGKLGQRAGSLLRRFFQGAAGGG